MDIKIKSIKLLNFKGQRNTCLEFDGQDKSLLGANATGKTTMFDAFTWVLFGKDSKGAAQFDIKTLSTEGDVLWKLPHSVTVELLVDGKLLTLRKEYEEKWVKTRGETEETFRGHEVNRFWDDVPCTAAEYDKKVGELCEESLFRLITSPAHFNSLDDKEKMRLLNMLEGNTTDEQFMAASEKFAAFLTILNGKTLDEYKRELSAKIHAINTEIASLHTRLDEVNRNLAEEQDWTAIEGEITKCDTEISRLKGLQADMAKQSEEYGKGRVRIQELINSDTFKLSELENKIRAEVNADYNEKSATKRELERSLTGLKQEQTSIEGNISNLTSRKQQLLTRLNVLSGEYKTIHAEIFTFDESRGVCQTCKQLLMMADVDSMRDSMLANFNTNKARRLQVNIDEGNCVQAEIKGIEGLIEKHSKNIEEIDSKINEIEKTPLLSAKLLLPDATPRIDTDTDIAATRAKIAELKEQLAAMPTTVTEQNDYSAKECELSNRKSGLEKQLYVRSTIDTARARLSEIGNSIRTNGQQLLNFQCDENTIKEIQKAKALYVELQINSLFSLVRFKMVDPQINGGERQVCETTVNGVPYASLNNAARINAGLDIINTFCRFNGTTAPVFIDNAEAVNELLPMQSQVISLIVTKDKVLTLK